MAGQVWAASSSAMPACVQGIDLCALWPYRPSYLVDTPTVEPTRNRAPLNSPSAAWRSWPFYPRNLSDAVGCREGISGHQFLSLLASGWSELLQRPLTLVEPVDLQATPAPSSPGSSANGSGFRFARIDPINNRQNSEPFCLLFRDHPQCDSACLSCDLEKAQELFASWGRETDDTGPRPYSCHLGLQDLVAPLLVADRLVGAIFTGQFRPPNRSPEDLAAAAFNETIAILRRLQNPILQAQFEDAAKQLSTIDEFFMSRLRSSSSLADAAQQSSSFSALFHKAAKNLTQVLHVEWQTQKIQREAQFLQSLFLVFSRQGYWNTRDDVAATANQALNLICEFTSAKYALLFASSPEQISLKPNENLLPLVASSGTADIASYKSLHLNWRKAHLPTTPLARPPDTKLHSAATTEVLLDDDRKAALRSGLRGEDSRQFQDASFLAGLYLAPNARAAFVLGPISHLSPEDLSNESSFLQRVGIEVCSALLNALSATDSAALRDAWSDTAAILAHNARRALHPVEAGVRILQSLLQGETKYSRAQGQQAIESLQAVYDHLGAHASMPLEAFAATAERTYTMRHVPLAAIVDDIVKVQRQAADDRGVKIKVDPSVDLAGTVLVDPGQFPTAIGHLVDNAVKYSNPGRIVHIDACHQSRGELVVRVDDFGQGIDQADSPRLYEKNFQGARSRRQEHAPGEGVGLYHARIIARAHGGDITHHCSSGPRDEKESSPLDGYRVVFELRIPQPRSSTPPRT